MIIEIPYKPHEGQLLLHNDTHRYRVIVCGRRWGKTIFAVNELVKWAMNNKGQYWYVAPTYQQAKLIAWEAFKKYAIKEIRKKTNETDLLIEFINGSIIRLIGADNPDRLRGVGIQGVVLDEFADIKRSVWELVIRPTLADTKGWAIFLGTPKGKLNQLYEAFIKDKAYYDKDYRTIEGLSISIDNDYKSFKFLTKDNPYIDIAEIEKARLETADSYFKQEYEASFENYTGIIYKEFEPVKHVISIKEIPEWWNIYIGIDTGRHTAVSFVATDKEGINYLFDEVYNYDGLVKDIVFEIKAKLARWKLLKSRIYYVIDSASQVKREYEAHKIYPTDSVKDIENQIAQVRAAFSNGTLYFNDICKMHILEHKGYIWDEKSKKVEPVKENDHSCNSLQYIYSTYMARGSVNREAIKKYKQTLEYATHTMPKASLENWS